MDKIFVYGTLKPIEQILSFRYDWGHFAHGNEGSLKDNSKFGCRMAKVDVEAGISQLK